MSMKTKLMFIHYHLVSRGEYHVAKRLMWFLHYKRICLGLDDTDWELERILNKAGLNNPYINSRTGSATYWLPEEN